MQTLRALDACPRPPQGTAVTIGAYDGVHRGHRAVISTVRHLAGERGLATAVVTFDRHPASVVRPESAPRLLTDLDQKLELLEQTGVDYALVVHFDEERSRESAEDFVREVLVNCLNAKLVVVGADFHFGHQRRGNVALLEQMGREHGFEVIGMSLVGADGAPARDELQVSSTAIRRALLAGDVALATRLLGHEYEVRGVVEHGDERGRTWGFPTANVAVSEEILLPADGIYAGWYERPSGERLSGAISLGRRPTVYEAQPYRLLEVHLLDWEGDLYDEEAKIRFVAHLRDEVKFDSVDELLAQMHRDCDEARRMLGS
ncbi:MAG: riboflavin kinase / adenylyltransferase [Acidimicrobiaceae bacterium]|jgi:riboflavin kinase/FMN adenylyltransferase